MRAGAEVASSRSVLTRRSRRRRRRRGRGPRRGPARRSPRPGRRRARPRAAAAATRAPRPPRCRSGRARPAAGRPGRVRAAEPARWMLESSEVARSGGSGTTTSWDSDVPYCPIAANPRCGRSRATSSTRAGTAAGFPRPRMPKRSEVGLRVVPAPGPACGTRTAGSGADWSSSSIVLTTTGPAASRPASSLVRTSTATGSPLAGSAHTSRAPTVVRGSVTVTRNPAASTPATRRAGRATGASPGEVPESSRRASCGGGRSSTRGRRTVGSRRTNVRSWAP